MTLTKKIQELDELRAKATQGEWEYQSENYRNGVTVKGGSVSDANDSVLSCGDSGGYAHFPKDNAEYIIALHNAYPALRQAILERDRYKAAGEALAERMRNSSCPCCVKCYSDSFVEWRNDALTYWDICYRTAIDDSSKQV